MAEKKRVILVSGMSGAGKSTATRILEDMGYEVDLIEFVDLAHSTKNLMIRAEKKRAPRRKNIPLCRELAARYGFRQTLLELVDPKE